LENQLSNVLSLEKEREREKEGDLEAEDKRKKDFLRSVVPDHRVSEEEVWSENFSRACVDNTNTYIDIET
jgi:hypothetical protein